MLARVETEKPVIRDLESRRYYAGDETWVEDINAAKRFSGVHEAELETRRRQLHDCILVWKYDEDFEAIMMLEE